MKHNPFDVSPPKESYRYWPPQQYCLIETEHFVERLIFAKQDLKEWERVVLEQLDKYLSQRDPMPIDRLTKLRFLYGQGWSIPQTYESLKYHLKWKQEWPSYKTLIPLLQPVLCSGGIYIYGRDNRYRPCIVIRPERLSRFPYQLHLATGYFILEFIQEVMFIPGQIENWVLIVDIKKFRTADIINHKKLIAELFTHYPCRLGAMYLLRGGKNVHGLNKFLPQNTLCKLKVVEKEMDMLNEFNPQQLEIRYGGSAPNIKTFWPPVVPATSFRAANDSVQEFLSAVSSYNEYFTNPKINSDLSSLKASQAGERESFISNNDFKDEVWQRLELVSASYSFLNMEHLKTQGDEEKKEKGEERARNDEHWGKPKHKFNSEDATGASSREPNKILKDESEIPFMCNMCNSDCLII